MGIFINVECMVYNQYSPNHQFACDLIVYIISIVPNTNRVCVYLIPSIGASHGNTISGLCNPIITL